MYNWKNYRWNPELLRLTEKVTQITIVHFYYFSIITKNEIFKQDPRIL